MEWWTATQEKIDHFMRFLSMQLRGLSVFEVLGADAGCKDWLAPVALDCGGLGLWSLAAKCIKNRYYPGKLG